MNLAIMPNPKKEHPSRVSEHRGSGWYNSEFWCSPDRSKL